MQYEQFLTQLDGVKSAGKHQAMALCPAHDDREASLSVAESETGDKILLKCHAGCETERIVAAMGRRMSDLFNGRPLERSEIAKTYDYTDEAGQLLYQTVRMVPKGFWQRRPDGHGGWVADMKGVRRVLYRLPELLEAVACEKRVFIVEGEKDADALAAHGLCATTNVGGAGKWTAEYSDVLKDSDVVILPDNDEAGRNHAQKVAEALYGKAKRITILELPDLPPKGDASDWLQNGGTVSRLWQLVENALEWRPTTVGSIEPLPLRRTSTGPSEYPIDALGEILGPAARAIARVTQAAPSIVGNALLAAASAAVQAHANVSIDGRIIPASIFALSVAESGDRKSTVDKAVLAPHEKRQADLAELYREERERYLDRRDVYEKERARILKSKDDPKLKCSRLESLERPVEPPMPILFTSDFTVEGLRRLLEHGYPSIGVFSDEGGRTVGGHAMLPENQLKTISTLSTLWDGRAHVIVRGGDGACSLVGKRVSLHLMMQPSVAPKLFSDGAVQGQGFLWRCLPAWPPSMNGQRLYRADNLEQDPDYQRYFARMLERLEASLPLQKYTLNVLAPPNLPLDSKAKDLYVEFYNDVERQRGEEGQWADVSAFAARAAEHALRIAGVLALVQDLKCESVNETCMEHGVALARWYLQESLRIFEVGADDPDIILAEQVLGWMRKQPQPVATKDLYQRGPSRRVRTAADARRILQILERHGHIERAATNSEAWQVKASGE
jgi:hypothetical protein